MTPDPIPADALPWLSAAQVAAALRDGRTTSRALTEAMLARIEAHDAALNAFVTVTADAALAAADVADRELASGLDRGPFHGVPVGVKDLFDTAGVRTTAGVALWRDRVPDTDAHAVTRLAGAGAVSLGKTGMHELAWGSTSDNPHFGAVRNPWDVARHPGGSSGGSAAAVAAGLAYAALGTDTGCSVRQPAHCCGIVGYKPTFGLIGKSGVVPLVGTMDHVGTLARTVEDAARLAQLLMGPDALDPWSVDRAPPDVTHALDRPISGGVVAVPRAWFFDGVEPAIVARVDEALAALEALGVTLRDVVLPGMDEVWDAAVTTFVEVRTAHGATVAAHPEGFSEEVRTKMARLEATTADDYVRAQELRAVFRRRVREVMGDADVLALPTSMSLAEPLDPSLTAGWRDRARNTIPFNFTGQPGVSVPCGFAPGDLPVGLQLVARRFEDAQALRYAAAYQRATRSGERRPPAFA